mmetsp:Transcript_29060/g.60342  ORF Transcript_29060/g.60342 Transcript_29060/m.60342 type:complete len:113 (+) Transcript_29060:778-1116(+)
MQLMSSSVQFSGDKSLWHIRAFCNVSSPFIQENFLSLGSFSFGNRIKKKRQYGSKTHLYNLPKIEPRLILVETFLLRNFHTQVPAAAIRHNNVKMSFIAHDNFGGHDMTFVR